MSLPVHLSSAVTGATAGASVSVEGDEARHAVVVRRTRVGERIVLTDGAGTSATCLVESTSKSSLGVTVLDVAFQPATSPSVTVVQAIPKGERADLVVEVLTEVGVDRIVPWAAGRSVGVWRGERAAKSLARWRSTAREAAKQSRRVWLPEVTPLATTAEVVELLAGLQPNDLGVVLHEEASVPLADLPVAGAAAIVVVVGPEGGISEEELGAFAAAHVVRLGPTVLRTSTAGVAAVAAMLSRTRRWG